MEASKSSEEIVEVTETPSEITENPVEITEKASEITEKPDEVTETTEDLSSFASGIKTEDTEKGSETEFVLNGEIDERCPQIYETKRSDVSYGEFSHDTYYSNTCQMERGYSILLPADYSEDKKYPVLYLLHGIFGDEYSFSNDKSNKIKEIIGNMAADGIIEETILVCPNMYAASDPDQKPGFDRESVLPYDNFINDLVNDLMPYIEGKYSVLTGRENTYLAGFCTLGRMRSRRRSMPPLPFNKINSFYINLLFLTRQDQEPRAEQQQSASVLFLINENESSQHECERNQKSENRYYEANTTP